MSEDTPQRKTPDGEQGQQLTAAPRNSLSKIDALLEELNVVKLEGRYFCFDRTTVSKRPQRMEYRDGDRGLIIETSPSSGHPSVLAYRVLQAIFRKVTLEGKPYPDIVSFSYRELGRLIGREIFGGADSKQLYRAICQLEDTKVTLFRYEKDGKKFQRFSLRLLTNTRFIGEGDAGNPGKIQAAMVRLDPFIIESMRREHFAIFDWDKIESLEPLSAAFFKRLYVHFSNLFENQYDKASLHFTKDYADICAEWLGGLRVEGYKAHISKQLGAHLEALRRTGLIRSVSIEKKADGQGFKLVFKPGEGFFRDYALFYVGRQAPVLQFQQASDQFHIQGPIEGVDYFVQRLHRVGPSEKRIYSRKDTDYAKSLIEKLGVAGYQSLVDYAVEAARRTNFAMKSIRALDIYLPHWQATLAEREQEVARRRQEMDRQAADKLRDAYEAFRKMELIQIESRLSADERAEIDRLATEEVGSGPTFNPRIRERMVGIARNKILADRYPIGSFEEWKKKGRD